MLRKLRQWAKTFIAFDLTFAVAKYLAAAILGLLFLGVALSLGEYDLALRLLGGVAVVGTVLGFGVWVAYDARKTSEALRREPPKGRARPDGDLSEVAGLPTQPPWMG